MTTPAAAGLEDPVTLTDLLRLAGSPGFDRIQDQIRRTGGCSDPIHLTGSTVTRDRASGQVLHRYDTDTEPGGRLRIACGNRRASRCPAVSCGYARNIYGDVRAVLSAAVDDGLLPRNPCSAKSVRPPAAEQRRVVPWTPAQVLAVRAGLPERYRSMVDMESGCRLRQGEFVGLAEDALDLEGGTVRVVRQVKLIRGKAVFAPPKCNKERDVPLPPSVAEALRAHMDVHKPVEVTLPWRSRTVQR